MWGRQASGPASFTTMRPPGPVLAGDGLAPDGAALATAAQPACDQSSAFCGTVSFTKNSDVVNGDCEVGSSPEPYPPSAPGAAATRADTMPAGRCQSVAGSSLSAAFM